MKFTKLVKFALTPPIVAISVATAAVLGARAELLVYDGFSTDDYPVATADGKIYIYQGPTNYNHSVGTGKCTWFYSSSVWNSGQVYMFGSDYGLSYPEGSSLTAIGGSVGPNPDQNNAAVRSMYHALKTDVLKVSSGKLYMSMLLNAGQSALDKLTSAANPDAYHYGFGICRPSETTASWTMLATRASSLSFMIWNKNGTKTLSLVAVDSSSARKVADICTVTAGTTYLCYAEIDVGAWTSGKEKVKAGAVALDGNFDFTYDWTVSLESNFITDSSYPTAMAVAGSYGTNGDRFRADELRIGTTQADVLPFADGIAVKGSPLRYGEPSPGYGMKRYVVAGQSYTFTMPQGVYTNAAQKVYVCTGWTLTAPDGTVTSGAGLTKTVDYAGGKYVLTWNWIRSGYTPIDYIESTGTQWIDTKVVPTANTSLAIDYQLTTWSTAADSRIYLFGTYTSTSSARFQFAYWTYENTLLVGFGEKYDATTPGAPDTDRHTLEVKGGTFTLDGKGPYPSSPPTWPSGTSKNLCLFALNEKGTTKTYLSPYRLYGCKIYEGSTLLRDLVPVIRNSDGKSGLLDVAAEHDTFYSNGVTAGDDFTPGAFSPICMVTGSPSKYGEPSPGYGVETDIVAGESRTYTVPQGVCTNDVRTEVYTCTGWTLTAPDGTVTSGPELEKTVTFANGFHKLTWNWTVTGIFDGYTELEYIESTGDQYINTGLKPTGSTTFEVRYRLTEVPTGSTVFGVLGSRTNARLSFGLSASGVNVSYLSSQPTSYTVTGQPDTDIHTATLKGKIYYLDGKTVKSFSGSSWSGTAYALYLFAWNNAGSVSDRGKLRLYSCTFTSVEDANGATVNAEFVPCKDPSGKVGLYEAVSGRFLVNAATSGDDFTAGPVKDILVTGSPAEYGTPTPAYGWAMDLESGKPYTFTPPEDGEADGVKWQCTGWEFVTKSGVKTTGDGTATITYQEPGTLTWLFTRQFKVEFACSGGNVNTNKLWYDEGEEVTVTFTPDEGRTFQMWQGDVAAASKRENPLVFTVDGPKSFTGLSGGILEVGEGKTYADIATAVDTAGDYDTVLVSDGTYEIATPIHVEKSITVRSVNGAAVTTVKNTNVTKTDEGEAHRVFFINNAEALVEGFTISGGVNGSNQENGGGTRSTDAKVTEADYGSGVRIDTNGGTLVNCVISGNKVYRMGYGGGFAIVSDDGVISNCVIRSNSSSGHRSCGSIGYMSKGLLTHCTITNNTADGVNGALGGLYMMGGRISHCVFQDNKSSKANARGTAIFQYTESKAIAVDNTLIKDNSSVAGGAVCLDASAATFTNCTIVGNSAASGAGGVTVAANKAPKFYGCVFANNTTSATGVNPDIVPQSATFVNCYATTDPGKTGCASGPAAFADDGFTPTLASGFLNLCPPADYADAAAGLDVSGNPRLSGEKVDAGCAEYQYPDVAIDFVVPERRQLVGEAVQVEARAVIAGASLLEYRWDVDGELAVDWSASATAEIRFAEAGVRTLTLTVRADGTPLDPVSKSVAVAAEDVYVVPYAADHVPIYPYADKATAATNIAEALTAAADGSTVHVAPGTYLSKVETVVDYGVNLVSEEGAAVTTLRIAAGWAKSNEGDIPRPLLIDHKDAFVSGFTFSGGVCGSNESSGGGPRTADVYVTEADYGAGVRIGANGGTLVNCVISDNTSYRIGYGAGFAIVSDDGVISNCVIRSNSSSGHKGCGSIGYMSKGLLTHCTVTNNTAGGTTTSQGGLYMVGGRISHCVFQGNKGNSVKDDDIGVAIYQAGGTIAVDHTVIMGNTSKNGGAVYLAGTDALLDNCLVAGNSSVSAGAGVNIDKGTLLNCTIVDNVSESSGAGVNCRSTSPVLRNCLIQGNVMTGTATAATTNVNAATKAKYTYCLCPETLPTGAGNVQATVTLNSRYVPKPGSAAVDAGSVDGYEEYLVGGTDLLGKPRIYRKVVDIGCCENQSGGLLLMVR